MTVGVDYLVVGLGLWGTTLLALVEDDAGRPAWLPAGLFAADAGPMPAHWEFQIYDGVAASGGDVSGHWLARWGYPELVRTDQHSDDLVELEPEALRVFHREVVSERQRQSELDA